MIRMELDSIFMVVVLNFSSVVFTAGVLIGLVVRIFDELPSSVFYCVFCGESVHGWEVF